MKNILTKLFVFACFLSAVSAASVSFAQNRKTVNKQELRAATSKLREMYFDNDFEGGRIEGERLVALFRGAPELRAWYSLNLAADRRTSPSYNGKTAIDLARRMIASNPRNPWGWFALAGVLCYEV